jgi:hypothetical protein
MLWFLMTMIPKDGLKLHSNPAKNLGKGKGNGNGYGKRNTLKGIGNQKTKTFAGCRAD